jgi:hypothetical protein
LREEGLGDGETGRLGEWRVKRWGGLGDLGTGRRGEWEKNEDEKMKREERIPWHRRCFLFVESGTDD